MARTLLGFRYVVLVAALGAVLGAMLMFWQGGSELVAAAQLTAVPDKSKGIAAHVMHATDSILFGVVLIVFTYAIAFGFAVELPPESRETLPAWMRVQDVGHLKLALIEVILVYMIVDVATDWAREDAHLDWLALIKPVAIFLIACASRLLSRPAGSAPRPL
jgi:uncharacterized membrane protein YqhA